MTEADGAKSLVRRTSRDGRPGPLRGSAGLGLPDSVRACLFDLDGVLTQTAELHAAAWKGTFDAYLGAHAARSGESFRPFDAVRDYDEYVDGKIRADGVRSFLTSRGIVLPEGSPDDAPEAETVQGLGNAKNRLVLRRIDEGDVRVYDGSVQYLERVRAAGLRGGVVSSSTHCREILEAVGLASLFEARIDGLVAERDRLRGKPAPDTYLAGARALGVAPDRAAVFEDALAGVEAGRAGGFGYVVGVDRSDQAEALRRHGADVVVSDLGDLLVEP